MDESFATNGDINVGAEKICFAAGGDSLANKMTHTEAFRAYGVEPRNANWSWSGKSADGKTVVVTLWKDEFKGSAGKMAEHAKAFLFHPTQIIEVHPDGSVTVRFRASGHLEMCWHFIHVGRSG
jgi:hypothetical protein